MSPRVAARSSRIPKMPRDKYRKWRAIVVITDTPSNEEFIAHGSNAFMNKTEIMKDLVGNLTAGLKVEFRTFDREW